MQEMQTIIRWRNLQWTKNKRISDIEMSLLKKIDVIIDEIKNHDKFKSHGTVLDPK